MNSNWPPRARVGACCVLMACIVPAVVAGECSGAGGMEGRVVDDVNRPVANVQVSSFPLECAWWNTGPAWENRRCGEISVNRCSGRPHRCVHEQARRRLSRYQSAVLWARLPADEDRCSRRSGGSRYCYSIKEGGSRCPGRFWTRRPHSPC